MSPIQARNAGLLVRRRIGLIIGPSGTMSAAFLEDLNKHLGKALGVKLGRTFLETGESAIAVGVDEKRIREVIREFTTAQKGSIVLQALSQAHLNAVLSFSLDHEFESALQEHANSHPAEQQITTIDDFLQQVPQRTMPVYKLLGSAHRDDFVCTHGDYLARRPGWQFALRAFADRVKDAPVLCFGVSECDWAMQDLVGQMLAQPNCLPSSLVMLEGESIAKSSTIVRLLGAKRVERIEGTVGELMRAAYEARPQRPLEKDGSDKNPLESLGDQQDIVKVVNLSLRSSIAKTEVQRLLGMLFAPQVPAWDPFVHDMDLPRELTNELITECQEALTAKSGDSCVVVTGPASTGKTVILKRTAYELAKSGTPTLWLKPCLLPDGRKMLGDFMKRLAKALGKNRPRIAVFADDPATLGTITIADALWAAELADLNVVLVCSIRTSDWECRDKIGRTQLVGPIPPRAELAVNPKFLQEELKNLPAYLVKIRAASSIADAERMRDEVKDKHAHDILASLYWLLPDTRTFIAESVREEYFRLGDVAGLTRVIIGQSQHSSDVLQKAYRFVSVAEMFRQPLPLEILVSALRISYSDWLETHGNANNSYGLIYLGSDVDNPEEEPSETVVYHTRNDIVTNIIVKTINGGMSSHAGEIEVMKTLLAACTGSSPIYREFCVRVLVRLNSSTEFDWMDYQTGLRLFDAAIAALPFEDKTLVHHKAVWIRTKGDDPLLALGVMQQALQTKNYPNASRAEADEHIFTSMARVTMDGMDKLRIGFEEGRVQVLKYLAKGRSESFFNPNAAHVQADLVLRLLDRVDRQAPVDYFNLLNGALADIDRGLILLQARRAIRFETDLEQRDMLTSMKFKLLHRAPFHQDLVAEADELWNAHRSQEGFVFVGRHLYHKALTSDDGSDFKRAFDFCQEKRALVERSGGSTGPGLNELLVHVYYRWRLQRKQQSTAGSIDWAMLEDLSGRIVASTRAVQDPLYAYVLALAKAQQNKWEEAHALFSNLRRRDIPRTILRAPRDTLRDANGSINVLQGTVRRVADAGWLYVEALKTEIKIDDRAEWPNDGAIAHARVEFAFAGPLAVPAGTMATRFM